jgi:phosphoglucomutase
VTTELIAEMAGHYNVRCYDVLTGFKFIADLIRRNEGKLTFIGGGEESYGFMIGDFVRDKDAVSSCAMIAEISAWALSRKKSIYDILMDMYCEFSLFRESLTNLVRKGKSGAEEIQQMMAAFRSDPPKSLNGSPVKVSHDYLTQVSHETATGKQCAIDLPVSNVLQFILEDGSKISIRPSGTEPKIKFYFSVSGKLARREDYEKVKAMLDLRIEHLKKELKIE